MMKYIVSEACLLINVTAYKEFEGTVTVITENNFKYC
jgi:hypothetical protein